ncbi:unnamed protein product [Adineta ricciae]|uniref:Beta-lactamase-related domain-containing protein n=1 Tax=Adineta ricciae TaxID=249248 RepID=A0A815B8H6_ADIRI|nr:unnamed protein product [Adineta ricciae]
MEPSKINKKSKSSWLCGTKKNLSEIEDEIVQEADDYLQSLVSSKTFSGSVLLARDNEIVLIKGYGCAEYILQEKNTSQTIFRTGSVTKPFTAVIILQLIERKLLKLNDKLSLFYPDYPHGNEITVKHLLSHTSGIENYTDMESFENTCTKSLTIDQLIDVFKNEPLTSKPGSKYNYSNSNYILLGLIIEKVTGKSYETNLRELILEPCHMNDTGYECDCIDISPIIQNRRACGYICNTDSNGFETCRFIDMSTARSAGGIYSTVEDLYRFDKALYGEKLLKNRTKKLMFKPVREHYALGWKVYRLKHGRIKQQHTGQIFGFESCFVRFPDDHASIIILSNLEQASVESLVEDLTDILFQMNK